MRARRRVACTALRGDARVVFRGNFRGVLVLSGCVLLCAAFRVRANMACVNGGGVSATLVGDFRSGAFWGNFFRPHFSARAYLRRADRRHCTAVCVQPVLMIAG